MILLSEIGDKTFFIAAIMAMKNPRRTVSFLTYLQPADVADEELHDLHDLLKHLILQVFLGAIGALASMTILSAVLGWAAPSLVQFQNILALVC